MILTLALAAGLAWPVYAESSTVPPEVTAHAYLVMDAQTGQVLVQKGGAERNYPASTRKIMTLALAMEKCGGRHDAAGHGQPGRGLFAGGGLVPCRAAAGRGRVSQRSVPCHDPGQCQRRGQCAGRVHRRQHGGVCGVDERQSRGAGPGGHPFCKCQRPAQRRPTTPHPTTWPA